MPMRVGSALANAEPHRGSAAESPATTLWTVGGGTMVAMLALVLFFFHLGTYGLWEPDEARYAEIAREMLASHNFIIPHLNYVPYLEKPPLLYWLTAGSMKLFGVNEFAARFVNGAAALIGVLATYFFALRTFDYRRAFVSGSVLATSALYALMAQVLTTDLLLTAATSIAIFAFFLQSKDGGHWWLVCYFALSAAVLTKGPVGAALPLITAAAFLWFEGEWRGAIQRFHVVEGLAIAAVITLPWFIAVTIQEPSFFKFYFVGEHLRRFFEPGYSHGEPIYYYIPVIAGGFLPWSLGLLVVPWRRLEPNSARRFCLIAVATVFLLFSLASSKLVPYILPAFPFLALLAADGLMTFAEVDSHSNNTVQFAQDKKTAQSDPRRLSFITIMLALAGAAVVAVASDPGRFKSPYVGILQSVLYVAGATVVLSAIVCSAAFWTRHFEVGIAVLIGGAAVTLMIMSYGRIILEPTRSYATLGRGIERLAPSARLICYPRFIESLPFYCRRRVILVGAKTELAYGAKHAPDASSFFFTRRDDLVRLWEEPQQSVLVIDRGALGQVQDLLGKYRVITSDSRKLALTQRSKIRDAAESGAARSR
ncbi:MAG: glycosyltransferase family 39 protein [Deltaproteobacteria bacterium]|nr:glycosyltransferase family 39 protein [Deltaproteobacteria bacterium]